MAEGRSDESESEYESCSCYADVVSEDESSKDSHDEDKKRILHEEEIRKYFRVDLMYKTRHDEWPRETYLQYKLSLNSQTGQSEQSMFREWSFTRSDRLFNVGKKHAEIILLKDLRDLLSVLEPTEVSDMLQNMSLSFHDDKGRSREDKMVMKMNLQIVMNYSPCKGCASEIEKFTKETETYCESDISIRFGSFYLLYTDDRNHHIKGLAKLQNAGIQLQLVWDSKSLKETIKKIGTDKEREERENKDRTYMVRVREKAEKLQRRELRHVSESSVGKTHDCGFG